MKYILFVCTMWVGDYHGLHCSAGYSIQYDKKVICDELANRQRSKGLRAKCCEFYEWESGAKCSIEFIPSRNEETERDGGE